MIKRRQFIAGLGSAPAWPLVARAQQGDRVRRIGVLMGGNENDPAWQAYVSAFTQALADLGWTGNVGIDLRWAGGDSNRTRAFAQELVGLQPDITFADSTAATVALQLATRTIPIVFVGVRDPVASGIVARLDRPSGNGTAKLVEAVAAYRAALEERTREAASHWHDITSQNLASCVAILEQRGKV
jgi:putative tryptophan/tyrosine transport system substrate-binding protein